MSPTRGGTKAVVISATRPTMLASISTTALAVSTLSMVSEMSPP